MDKKNNKKKSKRNRVGEIQCQNNRNNEKLMGMRKLKKKGISRKGSLHTYKKHTINITEENCYTKHS